MIFLAEDRPGAHGLRVDTLDEEERDFAELDRFHFDELLDIDLLVQTQLSFFVDFSQRAIHRRLSLVDFSFGKVKFVDFAPCVVVHHEEEAVKCFIENERAVRRNLLLVEPILFENLVKLADERLEIAPMLEHAQRELLKVSVVDVGLRVRAVLVDVEPATLVDALHDARELLLLLGQVYKEAHDKLVDFLRWDLRRIFGRVLVLLGLQLAGHLD